MSKIEAGHLSLRSKVFNLHSTLNDLEAMYRARVNEKGLEFTIGGTDAAPNYIIGDEHKIRQILINLLENALKFTNRGYIILRVCPLQEQGDSILLGIEVEDSGYGIAEDELETVFEAFVQTQSGQDSAGGTGLGMPISRKYAQLMGGDLSVTSQLGQGSVFRLDITVKPAQAEDVPAPLPVEDQAADALNSLAVQDSKKRILVVDDIAINRDILKRFLSSFKWEIEVREAENGEEAVEIFSEWKPDIILMDMIMPVMNGREATQRIKATEQGATTPIIAISASAMADERDAVLEIGVDGFVSKPFRAEDLMKAIRVYLD